MRPSSHHRPARLGLCRDGQAGTKGTIQTSGESEMQTTYGRLAGRELQSVELPFRHAREKASSEGEVFQGKALNLLIAGWESFARSPT